MMTTATTPQLIRLGYILNLVAQPPSLHFSLYACESNASNRLLAESEIRSLRRRLHPLDQAVVQQILAGPVFGQVSEFQVARLLPLLARRHTLLGEGELVLAKKQLKLRAAVDPSLRLLQLYLFEESLGDFALDTVALVIGSHCFALIGSSAYPVAVSSPQQLQEWRLNPKIVLPSAHSDLEKREQMLTVLQEMGIPQLDLQPVLIEKNTECQVQLHLLASGVEQDEPFVRVKLLAVYPQCTVDLSMQYGHAQIVEANDGGLWSRNLEQEAEALRLLTSWGFVEDAPRNEFVIRQDAALSFVQEYQHQLPKHWQKVGSLADGLHVHQDMMVYTDVRFRKLEGVLDLNVKVLANSGGDEEGAAPVNESLDMQLLLQFLRSRRKFIRLSDGSYVAPSQKVRQGLQLLQNMGVQTERALVSPLCVGLLRAMQDKIAVQTLDAATAAWLEELSTGTGPKPVPLPQGLQVTLRDYQRRGLDWLMMLHRYALTGILADDMGLGKTLQTLVFLLSITEAEGRHASLVVAPTSVINVWVDEARRHTPNLKVMLWYGPPALRGKLENLDVDLIVTSYGIVRRDIDKLANIQFRYVILDEAQNAKNAQTHSAHAIRQLKSYRRLALSGTPLENRPEELWSIFDFLAPGFLGTQGHFRKVYAKPIAQGEQEPLRMLSTRIKPLICRRLKSEVARDLPEKIESVVRCEMGSAQRNLYEQIAAELRQCIMNKADDFAVFALLTRLRQVCCDPSLLPLPPNSHFKVPPSAKLQLFEELMKEALASNSCVVVFSQFVQMQRRLKAVIEKLGVEPLWLHGGSTNRESIVARFQDPNGPRVIVVSLRAGGVGLTLTRANTVMLYDPWWNPAVERQATDRTHRLGQENTVTVYRLVCANTIEEEVMKVAQKKEGWAKSLLSSEGGAEAKRITQEDVLELLS